jgi:EAL domain-containing protein (putative c-di-GMP-specific phosphodiesterase class I)
MGNPRDVANVLHGLREFGVKIYLDDFGTGYSSLSHLHKLPVDALKIDRSFVHDVGSDEDSRVIISAITAMAQTLRKEVVAEGVETQEQLDFLRELRCDLIQGYLISKPVPADQFIASLRASVNRTRSALRLASRA